MKSRIATVFLFAALLASCKAGEGDAMSEAERAKLAEGKALFEANCVMCHGGGDPAAPKLAALQQMNPDAIVSALTNGKMAAQGAALSPEQRGTLAHWLTAEQAAHDGWEEKLACAAPLDLKGDATRWADSWGLDANNTRNQTRSRLDASNVGQLEKAWSLAFPGAATMRSQPAIVGDAMFLAVSDAQALYALDRKTGCVHWKTKLDGNLRSAVTFTTMEDGREVVIVGDEGAKVSVVDARDGTLVWQEHVGLDEFSTITGPITVRGGTIYVPHSTTETIATTDPDYECCRASGALSANRLSDGKRIWIHRIVSEPKKRAPSKAGTQMWGPAGASVWAAPVIDDALGLVYVGTGPISAPPEEGVGDSIIALDIKTGKRRWAFQATPNDLWNGACRAPYPGGIHPNCPGTGGVDFDFGAGLIRTQDSAGRALLIAGQKSGTVHALDPATGAVAWQKKVGSGSLLGGIHWGMAVIGDALFVPVNDPDLSKNPGLSENYRKSLAGYQSQAGLYKLNLATGDVLWSWKAQPGCKPGTPDCPPQYGMSGAAIASKDIILAGGMDGVWRAFAASNGKVLAQHGTFGPHSDTLNQITGTGGSIDNSTLMVADDMVFVQSGYGYFGGSPGNMLIAYRLKGSGQ